MSCSSDPATGVKVFSIGGRMIDPRQRCMGMTDEERRWRAQFLKDQVLYPNEPKEVPELYKATTNVFRRLWRTPMWRFQTLMSSILGKEKGYYTRHFIGKFTGLLMATYLIAYHLKYHSNDWSKGQNWLVYMTRPTMYPDDPGFPNYHKKTDEEYYDLGFYSSPYALKIKRRFSPTITTTSTKKAVKKRESEVECPTPE